MSSTRGEHAPHNAMTEPGEIGRFHDRCSDLMRELLDELADAPDRPRSFPLIEDALTWPRRRIASVLGGVSHLRHTEFAGRRPYRFYDEHQSASGRWELWMDAAQARAVRILSAMTHDPEPRVDHYIDALPEWQQAICRQVRELVHAADPEVQETIKRTVQPYFVLEGNICALLATKDHVNVFLYDGGIVPDPEGIITGGHNNKTARTVAVYEGESLNARALQRMFEEIIANNRAGGWRQISSSSR